VPRNRGPPPLVGGRRRLFQDGGALMSTAGIAISGQGALAQSAKVDVLANNLANISTVGFRRDTIGFRANLEAALSFDRRPGDLELTRRPLDLAIRGPAYFPVPDLA